MAFNNQQWSYDHIASNLTSKEFHNNIEDSKKDVFSVLKYIDGENIEKSVQGALSEYEKLFE